MLSLLALLQGGKVTWSRRCLVPLGTCSTLSPSLVITGRTLIIKGTGSEDFECFHKISLTPRFCFLLLCSLGYSPSLPPCLPPFLPSPLPLPTPSISGLRRHHCLNACPPGDASSPALMSQLMRRAAGQPGWDQRKREASILGAQVPRCCITAVTKRCMGAGGGPSAQFRLLYGTDFIRRWRDSRVSLNLELKP